MRAGFATAAAGAEKSFASMMRQTGHKTEKMLNRYIREANLFKGNAASGLLDIPGPGPAGGKPDGKKE
jgi:hypothetical protein